MTRSIARRLLENDVQALAEVSRWIALVLTLPSFWSLREEWPDLHQEALTRLIESLKQERYDHARDLRAYVQGIARYTALEALQRVRRERMGSANAAIGGQPGGNPEEEVTRRQMARCVLDHASEGCRQLIRAYFLEERSYAEIAESLDIPVGTVKSRLFRCLEAAALFVEVAGLRQNRTRPGHNVVGKVESSE